MRIRTLATSATVLAFAVSFGIANAQPLSVSCSGAPAASSIAWTATAAGGVAPISFLWGNGSTSTTQTLSYSPGTYSMNIQATDASSSTATSTCSATVVGAVPSVASFLANPNQITVGQSSTLSWVVSNASTTSLDNGIGPVAGSSYTVSPSTTTTYTLTAVNPSGTTTAQATVVVNASGTSSSVQSQIEALLQQIAQLQQQLRDLIAGQMGAGTGTTTPSIVPPGQIGKDMCVSLNRDLTEGDDGEDVVQLQQMLASDPNTGFNVSPTGFFGPLTMRAMMRFQEDNGIASGSSTDGSVGPLTRGFFHRHCGEGLGNGSGDTGNASSTGMISPSVEMEGEHFGGQGFMASTTGNGGFAPMIPAPNNGNEDHGNGDHGHGNGHGDN